MTAESLLDCQWHLLGIIREELFNEEVGWRSWSKLNFLSVIEMEASRPSWQRNT